MTDPTCPARSSDRQPEDDGDVNEHGRTATTDDEPGADSIAPDSVDDEPADTADADRSHLRDVPVGSGCTEIWEHLAEHREDDE
ncbi:hypothetical protein [Halovivax limisalsi]|uniref:hypothetical protein n=1 Tax=Halovivax limisalsi TaxID=1453760 RepID=UPI001FFCADAD|nr:hypothetical protein [Halovivax limisalsi]